MTTKKKILLAFDFDHTIIEENSDCHINRLCPDQSVAHALLNEHRTAGWTTYMQKLFQKLHSFGVTEKDYLDCMKQLTLSPKMKELFEFIDNDIIDCIIISDSNSVFIDTVLENYNVKHLFSRVFTNPAKFDETGLLRIEMYHMQNWCALSEVNMCKGDILCQYVEQRQKENVQYSRIGYVGDGGNDFCPSLCLRETDSLFARVGFRLIPKITKMKEKGTELKATITQWETADDILKVIECWIENIENDIVPENVRLFPVMRTQLWGTLSLSNNICYFIEGV